MQRLARKVTRYLDETLGEHTPLQPWHRATNLPLFLQERYSFFEGQLLATPLLFMMARTPDEETPSIIRKHLAHVGEKWRSLIVYVREGITSYNRKRLIEHRVPFIVPGKQMYLAPLGIDLRERFDPEKPSGNELSPSTQALLIYTLLQPESTIGVTAKQLRPRLCYSPITLSRAFDELEAFDLVETDKVARTRELHLTAPKRITWQKALPLMRSPVQHRVHIQGPLQGLSSGLSALAQRSMIAEPSIPTIAVSREDWKSARQHGMVTEIPMSEPGTMDAEIWMYPPHVLSDGQLVDPLSLYLSLHDDEDERVEAALEQMLEAMPW